MSKTNVKPSFSKDDPRLKSKRWKRCACGRNLMHSDSEKCWQCRGLGNPKNIAGENNPYARFLKALAAKPSKAKASKAKPKVSSKDVAKVNKIVKALNGKVANGAGASA